MIYKPPIQNNTQFGTELFPDVIQAPPRVRTVVSASQEWYDQTPSPDQVAEGVLDYYSSSISRFAQTQRQSYALGGVAQRRTATSFDGLDVGYTNNQGTETFSYTVRPESLPPEVLKAVEELVRRKVRAPYVRPGVSLSDLTFDGYILMGTHDASPVPGTQIFAADFISADGASYTSIVGEHGVGPGVLPFGDIPWDNYMFKRGFLPGDAEPPNKYDAVSNPTGNIYNGVWVMNHPGEWFFGVGFTWPVWSPGGSPGDSWQVVMGYFGDFVKPVAEPAVTARVSVNGVEVYSETLPVQLGSKVRDLWLLITFGKDGHCEFLKLRSLADAVNPFGPEHLLQKVIPPNKNGALPALFPFLILDKPNSDSFWFEPFWSAMAWGAFGSMPSNSDVTNKPAIVKLDTANIPKTGLITVRAETGQHTAKWSVWAEFLDRNMVPCIQGPHQARGQDEGDSLNAMAKPRWWTGTIGGPDPQFSRDQFGRPTFPAEKTMTIDLSKNVSSNEVLFTGPFPGQDGDPHTAPITTYMSWGSLID